ncbi:NrsF family protein [Caenimonas koreensis]|nr:DUF1109 domain-containing protein [Caenimonas koreensis]
MKTDDLISLLAADTAAVPRRAASRQIAIAMAAGIPLAILAMLVTMGARVDLPQAIHVPIFWLKVLFPAAVACAAFATLSRLARPGVSARSGMWAIAGLVVLLWLMAIAAYAGAPSPERAAMVWGQSWQTCTLSVLMLSVPIFVAAFLAVRQLAPTRLTHAGACAGLLSGAAAASIYAFHCPESALPFMAIWYVAGIAAAAGIGAALGPRLLRW